MLAVRVLKVYPFLSHMDDGGQGVHRHVLPTPFQSSALAVHERVEGGYYGVIHGASPEITIMQDGLLPTSCLGKYLRTPNWFLKLPSFPFHLSITCFSSNYSPSLPRSHLSFQ